MATLNKLDLEFVLTQIRMAENGQPPVNPHLPFGLRQVNGENNNAVPGQAVYGSADQTFPRIGTPVFLAAQLNPFTNQPTSYAQTSGLVVDSDPRTISNLISDQSAHNPAAVDAAQNANQQLGDGYVNATNPATPPLSDGTNLFINNVTPDAGLSAPFNSWMTFFGQFFDHGLDFVDKSDAGGTVFIPLKPDDPLYSTAPGVPNFMVLTRATNQPGPDGILGTSDDLHEATNTITPFVDQNQTYSSHPSHQVFLRAYITGSDGKLHSTGALLDHVSATDGSLHMPTWADVKQNALKLGILLTDKDVGNVPLLATDEYGNFIPDPVTGMAQLVVTGPGGVQMLVHGTPDHPVGTGNAVRTGHAFLNDINNNAVPVVDSNGNLVADTDTTAGNAIAFNPQTGRNLEYDNELLDSHYIAGDGRANENMGLTAVHEVFHAEHNRQIEQIKQLVRSELSGGDASFALEWTLAGANLADGIQDNEWNGERLFQAAKFATETQYQHLVFEEFARKISPAIHLFGNTDIRLDPAISAEFAHAVYRFGHSMLDENVDRYVIGPDGTPVLDANGHPVMNNVGLIQAFLNPLAYDARGAGAAGEIVLGSVNQIGNEIDEFVTGALRNNLLGLPLDLPALNIARGRDTGVPPLNLLRKQIYEQTHDTALKPYDNWDEFGSFLKHQASLVNFVAAYGTHQSILTATTMEAKRAAAVDLVTHGMTGATDIHADAWAFMHSTGIYANDRANPMALHDAQGAIPQWSTGSITGLDRVDLWIGGLAEKQNLFGGLLGSTFDFIFRTQLENLQDGDRLYYLPRIEGTHWGEQIESNSFADLIERNLGVSHLPASIFLTPEYTVEAKNINPNDPSTWTHNPQTGKLLLEVLPDHTIRFLGDDNFFGNTITMAGTDQADHLIAGQADDDTVYGDGGNDILDGGNGNDFLFGGDGDDLITDSAGDDVIHGEKGRDTILAGLGADIIFGNEGNDFIDGGRGIDEVMGGEGNDIIIGGEDDDELVGNEGDDWIEGGIGGDLLNGDFGAPTGQVPMFSGNDVLDGGAGGDRMQGFSGDDIMLGEGGFDKFEGRLGYDWASYEHAQNGVSVDMNLKEFIPNPNAPGGDAVRDVFTETEAVSGSAFDDFLQGTDDARADPFNELVNFDLIDGLRGFFPNATQSYSGGNIMLGGAGSDVITGRGGNDVIDGDAALHVELSERAAGGQILRYITNDGHAGDIDTAVFSDVFGNYEISFPDEQGFYTVTHVAAVGGLGGGVGGGLGAVDDGVDRIRNIERLQFADITVQLAGDNSVPLGQPQILGDTNLATPIVDAVIGSALTVDLGQLFDPDGITGPVKVQWQVQDVAKGRWLDIVGATGNSFTPANFQNGEALRVQASFVDGKGFTEHVFSNATNLVAPAPLINTAPRIVIQQALNGLPDSTARSGVPVDLFLPLLQVFTDDQTAASALTYTATLANGQPLSSVGLTFTVLSNATGVTGARITGTAPLDFLGALDIRVKAADAGPGTPLSVTDTFTLNVVINIITGTEGADNLLGGPGIDRINARGGNDTLDGGAGADTMIGGLGNDRYFVDNAGDVVTEQLNEGIDSVFASTASHTLAANVENLTMSSNAGVSATGNGLDNAITTSTGNDTLLGMAGNDVLTANAGNDLLDGGSGADIMKGGTGNDTYVVDNINDQVIEAGQGNDTVVSNLLAYTLAADLENLTHTGGGDFTGNGNASANTLIGGSGNDTLNGGGGNDILNGGLGADKLTGGTGNDTYIVDNAGDQVVELNGEGTDTVQSSFASWSLSDFVENLQYTGSGNFTGTGNGLANSIKGGAGSDTLFGMDGNDTLDGGAGADSMSGGLGNDTYIVDNAGDVTLENAGEGVDMVKTALSTWTLASFVENLMFTGSGDFVGTGNSTSNTIWGGAGNDTLSAGASADILYGGLGNDWMDGGTGNDRFVFEANFGQDRIAGFDSNPTGGQDLLDVKALGINAASFAGSVLISTAGADTLIQIGADSITLLGVASSTVDVNDFLLAP